MSSLFEGNDQGKMFSHNLEKLEDGDYRCAGILVGMSILHDGPGLKCLHENVYKLMTGLPVYLNCLEILSGDSLEILEQVGLSLSLFLSTLLTRHCIFQKL